MSFQLRPGNGRAAQYPNAQDPDFLGYDRPSDRWKVDASGIHLYASGISVELDKDDDSVSMWSASGTPEIPIYTPNPINIYDGFEIPPYDRMVIDEAAAPASTVITYYNGVALVSTKTITVLGTTTTIGVS